MAMSTYSPYFLPLPPGRKYSQPLKIRPFIQDRGRIHCCNESATGGTEQGSEVQSTRHSSLENSPCNSPMVSLQGSGLRDKLASRGYKEAKRGSHRGEEIQEHKKGRRAKTAGVHHFSQRHWSSFSKQSALWANLIMKKETRQVDWPDLSSNFHLALSPGGMRWKSMGENYTFLARCQGTLSHLVE